MYYTKCTKWSFVFSVSQNCYAAFTKYKTKSIFYFRQSYESVVIHGLKIQAFCHFSESAEETIEHLGSKNLEKRVE